MNGLARQLEHDARNLAAAIARGLEGTSALAVEVDRLERRAMLARKLRELRELDPGSRVLLELAAPTPDELAADRLRLDELRTQAPAGTWGRAALRTWGEGRRWEP